MSILLLVVEISHISTPFCTPCRNLLDADEIIRLAALFVRGGVEKIRLTGGEPSTRSDLVEICERLSALRGLSTLAITSNGLVLARQLPHLRAAGLTHLNISLDTLVSGKFEFLTRRKGHDRVLDAIQKGLEVGFSPVKVNCVVMRGLNDDEITDFVELTRDQDINVRFIEFMPFDGNVWRRKKMVSYAEMLEIVVTFYFILVFYQLVVALPVCSNFSPKSAIFFRSASIQIWRD